MGLLGSALSADLDFLERFEQERARWDPKDRELRTARTSTIVMRTEYLAAIVIAVLAAGTGLAVTSVGSLPSEKQSSPAAAQLALAQSVDPFFLRSGG